MKASELIEELQEQIELHGDCEVRFVCEVELEGWNGGYILDMGDYINFVHFDKGKKEIHIF
jgi:hypothetical protein